METLIATVEIKEHIAVEERLALFRILARSGLLIRANENGAIELLAAERENKQGLDTARH